MTRAAPLPIPAGGFDTDEAEARWIEQTILMRAQEGLASLGLGSVSISTKGLYDIILLGMKAAGKRANNREIERRRKAEAELAAMIAQINAPIVDDWFAGVRNEAPHQQQRWGAAHDAGKSPLDWFWLIGYLAQKAAFSAIAGDHDKVKHHTISTAAALLNWWRQIDGLKGGMRPGIEPPVDPAEPVNEEAR